MRVADRLVRLVLPLVLAVFGVCAGARSTHAATLTVDTTVDDVTKTACTDAPNDCSLRGALKRANAVAGPDIINLPAGIYTLTSTGPSEELGNTGDLDLHDDVVIQGAHPATTIIQACNVAANPDCVGIDRIFHMPVNGKTHVFRDVTLRRGNAFASNTLDGGALYFGACTVTLERVVLSENGARHGGAILSAGDGTLTIIDSIIEGNFVSHHGGGLWHNNNPSTLCSGSPSPTCGNFTIRGSLVTRNFSGTGGASPVSGLGGAGIMAFVTSPGKTITIENTMIHDNHHFGTNAGGGLWLRGNGMLSNVTVSNNTTNRLGGGWAQDCPSSSPCGTLTVKNTTVSGNTGGTGAGGIEVGGGTLVLSNSTITGNRTTAGNGGGVRQNGSAVVMVRNSIIGGNTDGLAPVSHDCNGTLTSQGYNLIQDTSGCVLTGDGSGNLLGQAPGLGPLEDNGGETFTHALLPDSPALNAGNPGVPGSGGVTCEGLDQREATRPGGVLCDIGAFEVTADLKTTAVTNPPATVFAGRSFTVTDTARNVGDEAVDRSTTRYYLGSANLRRDVRLAGARRVPALAANALSTGDETVTVPVSTPAGSYFLTACADDLDVIAESDERVASNCRSSSTRVTVVLAPDLRITALSNPPAELDPNGSFNANDTTRNNGPGGAGASAVGFLLSTDTTRSGADRLLAATRAVGPLAAGVNSAGQTTLRVPVDQPPGEYFLIACADHLGAVTEWVESNNCKASTTTMVVRPLPDLRVTSLGEPPANGAPGGQFQTLVSTKNFGNVAAASTVAGVSLVTRLYLSIDRVRQVTDRRVGDVHNLGTVEPDQTKSKTVTVNIPSSMTPGSYFLIACSDADEATTESIETNNCRASTGTMTIP